MNWEPPRIPFHERFIPDIENGVKRFTIRLNPNYDLQAGREAILEDHRGNPLRTVRIYMVAHTPAGWIPMWEFDGHRDYTDLEELQEELAEYYPETDVDADTAITVIGW